MKRKDLKVILIYVLLIAGIVFFLSHMIGGGNSAQEPLTYDDVVRYFTNGDVAEFHLSQKNILTMKLQNGTELSYKVADISIFYSDLNEVILEQISSGTLTRVEYEPVTTYPWWLSLLPYLIVIVLFIALWIYMMNAANGKGGAGGRMNGFGKARVKTPLPDDKNRVVFADVAGADEEKEELQEIVEFLKNPAKYNALGAKIPHGVLLVGPPGTGKTLLAKAVAGEAGVPFFSISGSDFVEMYVGVGASRVRDLFETARKAPASIVFIDEIDAVGRHRGAGLGGGHDEREQTLNQLLVEMDGFGSHDGIIVIAATNRPDILDPALLRPGRFDRRVTVNYPDIKGREEILLVHAKKKQMEPGIDYRKIAQSTVGFTGADLANLLNEAALLAARRGKALIGMDEVEASFMKMILGPQKRSKVRNEHDNRLVAYHEAGHAVASFYCEHTDPIKVITTVPAGNAGGVTVSVPTEDTLGHSRSEMFESIIRSLGGRVAEELMMDDISTGASGDIQQATRVARDMVTRYGMSDRLGPILYGSEHSSDAVFLGRDFSSGQNYSDATAAAIDEEIHRLIDEAQNKCRDILTEHKDKLEFVAQFLLAHETMDGDQFKFAMENDDATEEQLLEIAEQKARESREANERERERQAEEQTADEVSDVAVSDESDDISDAPDPSDTAESDEPTDTDNDGQVPRD